MFSTRALMVTWPNDLLADTGRLFLIWYISKLSVVYCPGLYTPLIVKEMEVYASNSPILKALKYQ